MIESTRTDGVAHVVITAPPLNILTSAVLRDLRCALERASRARDVRVIVLSAAGKHFSAGAAVDEHLPPESDAMLAEFEATTAAVYDCAVPVIAAVQGRCLGGAFELIQAVDMVVAGASAQFGQPEIVLGVFPPVACALLPERVGAARAAELLFTGDPIGAAAAHAAGIVNAVVPDEQLTEAAAALARRVARHSGASLRLLKRALRASAPAGELHARVAAASQLYARQLMQTRDAIEGLTAFMAKRQPQWSHQ